MYRIYLKETTDKKLRVMRQLQGLPIAYVICANYKGIRFFPITYRLLTNLLSV